MPEQPYEITITAKDVKGDEAVVHAELLTTASSPHEAAREMVDAAIKQRGNSRVHEIDAAR